MLGKKVAKVRNEGVCKNALLCLPCALQCQVNDGNKLMLCSLRDSEGMVAGGG